MVHADGQTSRGDLHGGVLRLMVEKGAVPHRALHVRPAIDGVCLVVVGQDP